MGQQQRYVQLGIIVVVVQNTLVMVVNTKIRQDKRVVRHVRLERIVLVLLLVVRLLVHLVHHVMRGLILQQEHHIVQIVQQDIGLINNLLNVVYVHTFLHFPSLTEHVRLAERVDVRLQHVIPVMDGIH